MNTKIITHKIASLSILLLLTITSKAGETTYTFTYAGKSRSALIYTPASYNANVPSTLIMALHGTTQTNNQFKMQTEIYNVADTGNFIVVIPQGLYDLLAGFTWNSGAGLNGYYPNNGIDDAGFLNALLDSVKKNYNINNNEVFAFGFSMGGFMCNRLACEMSPHLKGIASVSGTIGSGITCNAQKQMPFLHIHGTADFIVPYTNSNLGMDAEPLVAKWVATNGCNTNTSSTIFNNNADSIYFEYFDYKDASAAHNDVAFYKVYNGAHWWYAQNQEVAYTTTIWNFFRKHKVPSQIDNHAVLQKVVAEYYCTPQGQVCSQAPQQQPLFYKVQIMQNGSKKVSVHTGLR